MLKKSISKMKIKRLQTNDLEMKEKCIICLDNFKVGELVRFLPCM